MFKENINEIEENDFPSQANAIQFGQTMHGSLGVNDTDIYALMVERGDQIAVELLTDSPHPLITAEIQTKGKKVKILKADDRYVTQAVEDSEYLFVISSWRPWVDYRLHIAAGE